MVTYRHKDFLEFMPHVKKYSRSISALNDQWDNVKLLCEIDCPVQSKKILPSMAVIQDSFYNLQEELIDTLITETLNKMEQKTVSKAQVAVDILIRNLYERTADVGFLATDDEIRRFVSKRERTPEDQAYIMNRLREYVAKYSVYEEIVILDKDFNVLANLNQANPIAGTRISDPLLEETLTTNESFVETFQQSPLQAGKKKAHIFSCKIIGEGTEEIVGVICLCFRFENEMQGIFKKLCTDYDGSVILILDEKNTAIASSDANHVPEGIQVEPVGEGKDGVVYYRGLEYIAKTIPTQGYQGYFGLGWKGHVMIPLKLAFKEKAALSGGDPQIMSGLMNKADSFSKELNGIVGKTQEINHSLKRIVYNGQILTKADDLNGEYYKLKPLLGSIGKIGSGISQLFEKSIQNLFTTVITTSLLDESFLASLCIDIMDRNLYERSDDCRWWALNSTFRTIMAHEELTDTDRAKLTKILSYINSLYTVYSNLFLFDKGGRIVAVSNPERSGDIGKVLDDSYVRRVLNNAHENKYFVSHFAASDLYNNRHTYIYSASITDISNSRLTVGGIGIVFDSEFQFEAMLRDSIKSKEGSFALFATRSGKVISSIGKALQPGSKVRLPQELLELENGASASQVMIYDGCYYAVGCGCSSSYREYKSSDGYKNDILAFVFEKLADYEEDSAAVLKLCTVEQSDIDLEENKPHQKLVTFRINDQLFALEQSAVVEAVDAGSIIPIPGKNRLIKGAVFYNDSFVAVVDTHAMFGRLDGESGTVSHLLLVRPDENALIALEADELNHVLEVNRNDVRPVPEIGGSSSSVDGIVTFPNAGNQAMLVINPQTLIQKLEQNSLSDDWEELLPLLEKMRAEEKPE